MPIPQDDAATPVVRALGTHALLVRVDPARVEPLRRALEAASLPGLVDVAAGGASVTVRFATSDDASAARRVVTASRAPAAAASPGPLVTLDVVYDGEDLEEVAAATARSVAAVVEAHASERWHVAFVGFAPGFAYLRPEGATPVVPRRASPRPRVPAGAVAVAASYSAVYPRSSPGGWQLLGRTDAALWDPDRADPVLLAAGTRVRFRAVRAQARALEPHRAPLPRLDARDLAPLRLEVLASGLQTLVQDLGREGRGSLGVARSGAADRRALRQANRLVGNPPDAAALEHVGGGLRLRAVGEHVLAVSGAIVPLVVHGRRGVRTPPLGAPFALRDGDELEVGPARAGLRAVVGVRGGIDVPEELGSRATDVLARLGPPPVAAGDALPIGAAPVEPVGAREPLAPIDDVVVLDVVPGPDDDVLRDEALRTLAATDWTVGTRSDRVGVRLEGASLAHRSLGAAEPESQALVPGAIQVPPSGEPIVFLVDHPATGGYPVVAVVAAEHLDALGQLAPGVRVRLRPRPAAFEEGER